jgi:hypothetical protein
MTGVLEQAWHDETRELSSVATKCPSLSLQIAQKEKGGQRRLL